MPRDNEIMETLQLILQQVDKGFKEIRTDIKNLDMRLTKVEINQEKTRDDIRTLVEGHQQHTEALKKIENKIDEVSLKVDKHDIQIQVIEGGRNKAN